MWHKSELAGACTGERLWWQLLPGVAWSLRQAGCCHSAAVLLSAAGGA